MRDIERYTEEYNKNAFENYQVKFRRKNVLEIMRQYQPKCILEIGCGNEPLFPHISWEFSDYVIVEPGVSFIENAKKIAKDVRIQFVHDYFRASEELKKKRFDYIICSGLLHEVEEPQCLLREIAAFCSKNTMVHINVPNANSMHRLLAVKMGMIRDLYELSAQNERLQQHMVFDRTLLCAMVEGAGFQVVGQGSYFIKPFTHRQMHLMLEQKILTEEMLDGLYLLAEDMPELGSEIWVNCKL